MSVLNIHQGHLEGIVQALFPGKDINLFITIFNLYIYIYIVNVNWLGRNIITNVRKDALVKNPVTGNYFEIDVWVPDFQLCFEFQVQCLKQFLDEV